MNKIAPKFEVDNESLTGVDFSQAEAHCQGKTGAWRLPTQREAFLILSMGGSTVSIVNPGFASEMDWTGSGFQKINNMIWTQTLNNADRWLVGANGTTFGAWNSGPTQPWYHARCVRTVQ